MIVGALCPARSHGHCGTYAAPGFCGRIARFGHVASSASVTRRRGGVGLARAMICATVSVIPGSPTQGVSGPWAPDSGCAMAETPRTFARTIAAPSSRTDSNVHAFIYISVTESNNGSGAAGRKLIQETLEVI